MFRNHIDGTLYIGDMQMGDRLATPEEIAAWELALAPTLKQQTDAICAAKGVTREVVWAVILATEGAARATALATGYPEAAVLAEAYTRMKLYRECKDTEAACRVVETAT